MKKKVKTFLITGVAGFIGYSFAKKLLHNSHKVIGIDNYDDYYSVKLKKKRIDELNKFRNFKFLTINIENHISLNKIKQKKIDYIYHLAAQAGVRHSIINPAKYINTNILGTINIFKFASHIRPKSVFFASSSSVYGDGKKFPLSEESNLDPKNIYATSKVLNEISAKSFSRHHNLKIYGLRFFTIYGEWGRPDMLLFKLLKNSRDNTKLNLNNSGNHYRDFTYIDDVVKILFDLSKIKIKKKCDIFNICSNNPQYIKSLVQYYKKNHGKLYIKNSPKNNLDVFKTHGNNVKIKKLLKIKKFTKFETGFKKTIQWYKNFNSKLIY